MSRLTQVEFMSQREAEGRIGHRQAAIISITDEPAPEAALQGEWARVLRLAFYDVEPAWARPGQTLFSQAQARAIWDFLDALPDHVLRLCVHCRSGISRSGAVARAVSERYALAFDGEEKECNAHVLGVLRGIPRESP